MNKCINIVFLLGILILSGCSFDNEWQQKLRYPATLELKNMAEEDIDLKVLYSSPDAKGHFSIDAGKLASREALNINITEMAYDIIQAKDYILEGTCGHIKDWKKEGDELRQTSVENEQQWKITVFIDNCNP